MYPDLTRVTNKLEWPWPGSSVGWSVNPTHRSCVFGPQSGLTQEATDECINKWNNKSMFLSLSQINKLKNRTKRELVEVLKAYRHFCAQFPGPPEEGITMVLHSEGPGDPPSMPMPQGCGARTQQALPLGLSGTFVAHLAEVAHRRSRTLSHLILNIIALL